MTSKEKIIAYMQKKDEMIHWYHVTKKRPYFSKRDQEEIETWDEKDCDYVWSKLIKFLSMGCDGCPFCIHSPSCAWCGYGMRHGICPELGSLYNSLEPYRSEVLNSKTCELEFDKFIDEVMHGEERNGIATKDAYEN